MNIKIIYILTALFLFNGLTSCEPVEETEQTTTYATGDEVDDPVDPDEDN